MIIGKFEITDVTKDFESSYTYGWYNIIPSIEYRHKYWYLWEIELIFWKWNKRFEICRTDWNKNNDTDLG